MSGSSSTYPLDTVVEITDEIDGVEYQASGVLISPDEVLTASHVVYQTGEGVATDVVVTPDADDGSAPDGTADGTIIHYNPVDDADDTISSADSQSDYAVIHLSRPFTNLGTMSIDPNFTGGAVTVSGYPASAGGAQVNSAQTVTRDPDDTLLEGRSIGAGSSGGPVWFTGSNGVAELVGLVSSGAGRQGYDVQITTAVAAQIAAWVAADDGTVAAATPTIPAAPAGFTNETVTGADGAVIVIAFPAATGALAATLLAQLSAATASGSGAPETATPGQPAPTPPTGQVGQLDIGQAGAVTVPATYGALIDSATGPVSASLISGVNVSVVAGSGGLTLSPGAASGTLVSAGGNTLFYAGAGGGAWDLALASGVNTIVAGGGADSISAGSGQNLIFLGTGADSVDSAGTDTIIGGGGGATIAATADALVFGGTGTLNFIAGAGASTVVGSADGSRISGGAGPLLYFGAGASTYTGASGADTVLGGAGSITAQGGAGDDLIAGGAAGENVLAAGGGATTMFGGGAGDVLTAFGTASDALAAGGGAETLTAAGSSGNNSFFAGSGDDLLVGGPGASAMIAGTGDATLIGGSGYAIFGFVDGRAGGTDLIVGFNPAFDEIDLVGYGPQAAANALGSAVVSGASTVLTLPDNTRIIFAGVTGLNAAAFLP